MFAVSKYVISRDFLASFLGVLFFLPIEDFFLAAVVVSEDLALLSSVQSAFDRLLHNPVLEPPANSSSAKAETRFEPRKDTKKNIDTYVVYFCNLF